MRPRLILFWNLPTQTLKTGRGSDEKVGVLECHSKPRSYSRKDMCENATVVLMTGIGRTPKSEGVKFHPINQTLKTAIAKKTRGLGFNAAENQWHECVSSVITKHIDVR
jgi:hypothetical protein